MQRKVHAAGWISHPLEPAVFTLYDKGALVGIVITHMDGLLYAGAGPVYERAKAVVKEGTLTFFGKVIAQDDSYTVTVGQADALAATCSLHLVRQPRCRRYDELPVQSSALPGRQLRFCLGSRFQDPELFTSFLLTPWSRMPGRMRISGWCPRTMRRLITATAVSRAAPPPPSPTPLQTATSSSSLRPATHWASGLRTGKRCVSLTFPLER